LIVDLSVQAFLTDEGYDPMYGARPLRRAIMKYLEDTLAEQCLSKTLYPNTKIYVRRKKVEGTLMTYTKEIEVEVDFSDVDPNLLDASSNQEISTIVTKSETNLNETSVDDNKPSFELNDSNLEDDELNPAMAGKTSRFFKKKN
jgi:hypothetical protein